MLQLFYAILFVYKFHKYVLGQPGHVQKYIDGYSNRINIHPFNRNYVVEITAPYLLLILRWGGVSYKKGVFYFIGCDKAVALELKVEEIG